MTLSRRWEDAWSGPVTLHDQQRANAQGHADLKAPQAEPGVPRRSLDLN